MLNWNLMAVAFTSLVGPVESNDISKSFSLMGKGMLGIFIVMLLIYLVIVLLGKIPDSKNED
jgi:hypothetical protein